MTNDELLRDAVQYEHDALVRQLASALRAEVEAHAETTTLLVQTRAALDESVRHLEKARAELAVSQAAHADTCGDRHLVAMELAEARGRIEAALIEFRHAHPLNGNPDCGICRGIAALSPPPPQPETKKTQKTR